MSTEHRNTGETLGKKGESEIEQNEANEKKKRMEIKKCYEESCEEREALHEELVLFEMLRGIWEDGSDIEKFSDSFEESEANIKELFVLGTDGKYYFEKTHFKNIFFRDLDLDIILVNQKDSQKMKEYITVIFDTFVMLFVQMFSFVSIDDFYFLCSGLNTLKKEMKSESELSGNKGSANAFIRKVQQSPEYDQYKYIIKQMMNNWDNYFEEHQNRIKKVIESRPEEQEELGMWFKSGLNEIEKYEFLDNNLGISLKKETDKNQKVEVQNPHSYVWNGAENTWKEIPESQGIPLSAPIKKIEYIQYPPHSSGEAFAGVHLLLADGRSTTVVSLPPPEGKSIPSSFTTLA